MPVDIPRPVLLYDGDHPFCRTWVDFWRSLTGDSVEYLPFQKASARFPEVPVEDCQRAVRFITPEGRFQGAEGVCRLLTFAPRYRWLYWCYRFVPGFAALASFAYRFIASHRGPALRITHALWGERPRCSTWRIASEVFSRSLAIIYAIAFVSFGLQARGLIGSEGILPATEYLKAVHQQLGAVAFWRLPTLFWFSSADPMLLSVAWGCAALSLASLFTKAFSRWQRILFAILWLCYLSIINAGQVFMSFQWDWLLVEAGFLGIFLRPALSRIWLFRWLLFRLMFESGAEKLLSVDPSWRNFAALNFHYETQPLPTPLAWYMNLAPGWFQQISVACVLSAELILPLLIFGPRRLKQIAGLGIIGYQILIILTGNYGFFNLLAIALCMLLFDDAFFAKWKFRSPPAIPHAPNRFVTAGLWTMVVLLSAIEFGAISGNLPDPIRKAARQISQFGFVNHYGLFSVMTTRRMEIQLEGSDDGKSWQPFLFRYKPGPLDRSPSWAEPLQPRVDWQMWFAALTNPQQNPWLIKMIVGLMRDSKPVTDLFERTPFPAAPPKYMRATLYEYSFTTWDEHQATGNYWKREFRGFFVRPIGIRPAQ